MKLWLQKSLSPDKETKCQNTNKSCSKKKYRFSFVKEQNI